ncbi:MAG TPA: hypothetical protein VGS06_26220 [Streptosporangiaceae bacterium]|nr:hypothetical protein [Streptosporangiaceae bacterium]
MLDRLALPTLPVVRGERVILRDSTESDVDDRLRHLIDPEEEDGYGSSWPRERDGGRHHTREHLLAIRATPAPGAYEWAVEYDRHCIGHAGLRVDADLHGATYTAGSGSAARSRPSSCAAPAGQPAEPSANSCRIQRATKNGAAIVARPHPRRIAGAALDGRRGGDR